jgi:two-component sensor histidine kinase
MAPPRRPRDIDQDQTLTDAHVFDAAPVAMWCSDLQGRLVAINHQGVDVIRAVTGRLNLDRDTLIGNLFHELFQPALAAAGYTTDHQVHETRSRVVYVQRLRTVAGVEQDWEITKQPWIDADGEMIGIIGACRQLGRHHPQTSAQDAEHRPLLPRTHTANGGEHGEQHLRQAMAMLVSLIQLMQRSPGCDELTLEKLAHRVAVISHIAETLGSTRRPVELGEMLRRLSAIACRDKESRLTLDGPAVQARPDMTISLALAFHELVHNSSVHGALSDRGGCTVVRWRRRPNGSLSLDWTEDCEQPLPAEPFRHGFGLSLLHGLVVHDLAGRCELNVQPAGVQVQIVLGAQVFTDAPEPAQPPQVHIVAEPARERHRS